MANKADIIKYITGLQHIGIPVNDFEGMIQFLGGLGFKTIREEHQPNGDPVAFCEMKGLVLEVYEDKNAVQHSGVIGHIAIDVKGIDLLFEQLVQAGYRLDGEGVNFLPYWENGIKYVTVIGPEGLKLEFCERL